eukprot:scaffold3087_cov130-Alexandrium_tamarense.AAC.14
MRCGFGNCNRGRTRHCSSSLNVANFYMRWFWRCNVLYEPADVNIEGQGGLSNLDFYFISF